VSEALPIVSGLLSPAIVTFVLLAQHKTTLRANQNDRIFRMKRTESLADLGDWPRVKIGQQSVIKHSYENALSASARLYSFATGGFPAIGGPIAGRQAILAAEDLLTFAIHSRRLFENTISTKRASQVKVPGTVTGPKEWISITRIINTLIRVAKKTDIAGQ